MPYEFACSTVMANCDELLHGDTEDEVVEEVTDHMREYHGMTELPPDIAKRVLASVRP